MTASTLTSATLAQGAHGPTITGAAILDVLTADGTIDDALRVELLGLHRIDPPLPVLEAALARKFIVGSDRIAAIKSQLSGCPAVTSPSTPVSNALPQPLAAKHGVVALATQHPAVVSADDNPATRAAVAEAVGTADIVWHVASLMVLADLFQAAYSGVTIDERPPVTDIYECLDEAVRSGASDMHLRVGQPPIYQIDGKLTRWDRPALTREWLAEQCAKLAGPTRVERLYSADHDVDLAVAHGDVRFRVNLGQDSHGYTVVARQLPSQIRTPDELGLPAAVQETVWLRNGLVLVTGPTGSGKTTTLAAILAEIAMRRDEHLLTLEDPIEYVLPDSRDGKAKGLVTQRELGRDFASFGSGLRQALRQKPETILVGELRDIETTSTALTAAETGHLVFGTMHTHDAVSTIERLISMFPGDEQQQVRSAFATVAQAIVSQQLLPRVGGGRVAAYEVMKVNQAIRNGLRKAEGLVNVRHSIAGGQSEGMQTMDMALARLVRDKVVRYDDAALKCVHREEFDRLIGA